MGSVAPRGRRFCCVLYVDVVHCGWWRREKKDCIREYPENWAILAVNRNTYRPVGIRIYPWASRRFRFPADSVYGGGFRMGEMAPPRRYLTFPDP